MTPEQEIEHEKHVAQILRIRKTNTDAESSLDTWLNSNVITALIGVIGTALLGTWVSGVIQDRSKNNELDRKGQESLLDSQNAAVTKVLERVGAFLSSTDDLLETVNNANSERGRSRADQEKLEKWKVQIRERRDEADAAWRRDKGSLGFTLGYVFTANAAVSGAWRQVVRAEDAFETCTRMWYIANAESGTDLTPEAICKDERSMFERSVEAFTMATASARQAGT